VTTEPPAANASGGFGVIGLRFNNFVREVIMGALSKSCLLFILNGLDAQLTLVWIRMNVATEGNALMARVLQHGELSFLGAKVAIGTVAAYILYRCAHLPLARHGLTAVLGIYALLMLIHVATGCVALGFEGPIIVLGYFDSLI
jgi:hypothetical protein